MGGDRGLGAAVEPAGEQGWSPLAAPGVVAIAVMLATFMEVLDTTVVNVSLPHIAGSLGAGTTEVTWVITSYLVSNAIVLPATGWLSRVFGRKRFYMTCVVLFSISSLLCGLAPSLGWLVLLRVVQGLGGGALQPISQAVLLETFPVRQRGMGMAIFGIGVVFAPVIGPVLGGWLTENYTWRWIFFINVPVGALALVLTQLTVADPPYLERGITRVDYLGLGFLAVGIGCLQVVLDKGQQKDWFGTTWILELSILSAVCLIGLVIWELRTRQPVIDLSIFRARNYAPGVTLIFVLGTVLYGSLVLLPLFLQTLLGYTPLQSGYVLSPGGIGTLICMPLVGYLVGRRDERVMIAFGLSMLSVSMFICARYTLDISFWEAAYPRIVLGVGLAFLFVPLATAMMAFMPLAKTGMATGIFNLLRNVGGSFGIAGMTTLLARRGQFHHARLIEFASPYNPNFQAAYQAIVDLLLGRGQPLATAQAQAYGVIYGEVGRQSALLSFRDAFWILGVAVLVVTPLVLIMRRAPRVAAARGAGAH
jgi:DHA2 family multidrug resistance protein